MLKAVSSTMLTAALLAGLFLPAGSGASPAGDAASAEAEISITNGKPARIADWPWQVAIARKHARKGKPGTPRNRTICGGAVIAPDLVATAGHCVATIPRSKAGRLEVISGRTWLNNEKSGEVVGARDILMPTDSAGKRLYREQYGSASWDVAIIRLKRPISATPIKLAGPDEHGAWSPGQMIETTGWGVTRPDSGTASPRLRRARQVMLKGRVCRLDNGRSFRVRLMNCHGGPGGNSSACFGDSGGPSVAAVGDGYRLVGLTSFGDDFCRGNYPSVDARISGPVIRGWVAKTAMSLSGVDVVGTGGEIPAPRSWCRIPNLRGLTLGQARRKLRRNRCRMGSVGRDPYSNGRRGRIVGSNRFPGWFAPVDFRLKVWLPR